MSTTSCLQRPSTSSNQPPQWMDLEMKFIYLHLFVSLQQMWQLNLPTNISRYLRPARRRTSAKLPLCAIVHCAGSDDTPEFWQYAGKSWIYNKCFSGTNGEVHVFYKTRRLRLIGFVCGFLDVVCLRSKLLKSAYRLDWGSDRVWYPHRKVTRSVCVVESQIVLNGTDNCDPFRECATNWPTMVIFADDICSICWHYWLILRMRNTARHHF